jgi:hypothetical protein
LECLGAIGKIWLKYTLKEKDGRVWTRQNCLCTDTSVCVDVNTVMNHRASRKAGEFIEQKIDYKILKKV